LWSFQGQTSAAKSENSVKEGKNLTSQRQNALVRAKDEKKGEAVLKFFFFLLEADTLLVSVPTVCPNARVQYSTSQLLASLYIFRGMT
jgi:hypothetical protein